MKWHQQNKRKETGNEAISILHCGRVLVVNLKLNPSVISQHLFALGPEYPPLKKPKKQKTHPVLTSSDVTFFWWLGTINYKMFGLKPLGLSELKEELEPRVSATANTPSFLMMSLKNACAVSLKVDRSDFLGEAPAADACFGFLYLCCQLSGMLVRFVSLRVSVFP